MSGINLWIKDQNGERSAIITLVIVSFVVTTAAYIISMFDKIGPVAVRSFDPAAAGTYFGAVLTAWVGHKWVDGKYSGTSGPSDETPTQQPIQVAPVVAAPAVPTADSQPLPPTGG